MSRCCVVLSAAALLAMTSAGCRSVRHDEALAMLDVSAPGLPAFTTARFSVAGRPEIAPHEVRYDGLAALRFGYYLPGPNGTLRITGQALSASCLVGAGSAEVDVQLGHVSTAVALVIKPLADPDPACAPSSDGGPNTDGSAASDASRDIGDAPPADATTTDLGSDAPDAARDLAADATPADKAPPPDAHPDVADTAPPADATAPPDVVTTVDAKPDVPPPPACMAATKACPGTSECCSGLVCGTTSLGRVCCGNYNMTCTRAGGEDCCGQLECVSGRCCLPATYACTGGSCCPGLVCGTTSLGKVCCGNAGAPCKRADGADCCGALECVNGVCK